MSEFVARMPTSGWARFLPAGLAGKVVDLFVYGADFLPVPASGSLNVDITIQNDSNFVILGAYGVVTETDNTTFLPYPAWPLTMKINDTGSGREAQSRAIHISTLVCEAQFPAPWIQPKYIRAGATFSTLLTNLSAVNRNVRISYVGVKVFGI